MRGLTGFFDSLCSDFPVDYRSNNSSSRRDIVGTIVLAILFGKDRKGREWDYCILVTAQSARSQPRQKKIKYK